MPLKMIIKEKRKEIGMTQEQVADRLGVSTPAVNKWENGVTFPDISLLPALARLLKVDLNTLLCFHEELSEQEINRFVMELSDMLNEDFGKGYDAALQKAREYPNCGKLIHTIALMLDGSLMLSGKDSSQKENYQEGIVWLYEQSAKCGDEETRTRSAFMLASKYIGQEEFEKAQEMIDLLPERSALDKRQIQSTFYSAKNQLEEAARILEGKLLSGINEVQMTLMAMVELELKMGTEENRKNAAYLADMLGKTTELFELWDYNAYVAPLQIAFAQENVEESLSLMRSMFSAALTPWDMKKCTLYRHISEPQAQKAGAGGAQAESANGQYEKGNGENEAEGKKINKNWALPALLKEFEDSPKSGFLQSNDEFRKLIQEFRAKC